MIVKGGKKGPVRRGGEGAKGKVIGQIHEKPPPKGEGKWRLVGEMEK